MFNVIQNNLRSPERHLIASCDTELQAHKSALGQVGGKLRFYSPSDCRYYLPCSDTYYTVEEGNPELLISPASPKEQTDD